MNKVVITRWLSLISYLGLFTLNMLWLTWLGDVPKHFISLYLLFLVGPMLLPLRGILRGEDKALIWGSLICLLYAVYGGMTWYGINDNNLLGAIETIFAVTYIFSASFFTRWRAEQNAAEA